MGTSEPPDANEPQRPGMALAPAYHPGFRPSMWVKFPCAMPSWRTSINQINYSFCLKFCLRQTGNCLPSVRLNQLSMPIEPAAREQRHEDLNLGLQCKCTMPTSPLPITSSTIVPSWWRHPSDSDWLLGIGLACPALADGQVSLHRPSVARNVIASLAGRRSRTLSAVSSATLAFESA